MNNGSADPSGVIRRVVSFFCPSTPPVVLLLGVSTPWLTFPCLKFAADCPPGAVVNSETGKTMETERTKQTSDVNSLDIFLKTHTFFDVYQTGFPWKVWAPWRTQATHRARAPIGGEPSGTLGNPVPHGDPHILGPRIPWEGNPRAPIQNAPLRFLRILGFENIECDNSPLIVFLADLMRRVRTLFHHKYSWCITICFRELLTKFAKRIERNELLVNSLLANFQPTFTDF
jgi:hypothetical protein